MVNGQADLPVLQKLDPDICFGYLQDPGKTLSCIPDMLDFYGQVDYSRTSRLLTRVFNLLDQINTIGKGGNDYGAAPV
jgi:hypothetical protein